MGNPVHDAGPADGLADEQGDPPEVDDRPIPPGVAVHMRTLECPPAGEADADVGIAVFAGRADAVLDEIVDGLCDDLGVDGDVTALGVSAGRNSVTGARGLILRRLLRRGRYSAPLAEIFSEKGLLDLNGKQRFCAFRADAYRHGLDLWIHEVRAGGRRGWMAFAIIPEKRESDRFRYAARLLVTPFEIGQWRDEFLEAGCDRPS